MKVQTTAQEELETLAEMVGLRPGQYKILNLGGKWSLALHRLDEGVVTCLTGGWTSFVIHRRGKRMESLLKEAGIEIDRDQVII